MEYTQLTFIMQQCTEESQDILCALLADLGFDSFEYTDEGLHAYILTDQYDESALQQLLTESAAIVPPLSFRAAPMETEKDWNEEWERNNFDPVLEREFGIKLDPRMAFGSGSHETTHQLVEYLMQQDFSGQECLDMGTGTGVLGIAMALRNAAHVQMIDIDINSVNNAGVNCFLNNVQERCDAVLGDASAIDGMYHVIVANIHKNILINDMPTYAAHLLPGGRILFSGFFLSDVPEMQQAIETNGLHIDRQLSQNDWTVLVCTLKA